MDKTIIKNIVIVGGGTSGWMTAAMLAKLFKTQLNITLIESDIIGTIGVGEATIPPLQIFNSVLGISEKDFIKAPQVSFKLGIEFENRYQQGDAYLHAFGNIGRDLGFTGLHHYWLNSRANNLKTNGSETNSPHAKYPEINRSQVEDRQYNPNDFWQYSLNYQAAKHNKFQPIQTIAQAQMSGIPLQHLTGNGIVYSSQHMSDEQAKQHLLANLDAKPLAEPRKINFTTGRRVKQWHKNCSAISLSSGFLEPLESTSLHLVQSAIIRLTKLFPRNGIQPQHIDEFNRQSQTEFEQIRDFIILHYHLNAKQSVDDERGLWQQCRDMDIPESLQHKIDLFKTTATVFRHQDELFTEAAWIQVMLGQGIIPEDYHPLTQAVSQDDLTDYLTNIRKVINTTVSQMPSHKDYIAAL